MFYIFVYSFFRVLYIRSLVFQNVLPNKQKTEYYKPKNALAAGVPVLSNFLYFIPKSFVVDADINDRHTRMLKKNRATNYIHCRRTLK